MGHHHGILIKWDTVTASSLNWIMDTIHHGILPTWSILHSPPKKWLLIIFKMDTVYMAEKYGEGFNYRSEIGHANPGTLPEFHGADSTLFLGGMQHGNVDFIELTWC